jgi:CBS domain containing-hemolysin-like protein
VNTKQRYSLEAESSQGFLAFIRDFIRKKTHPDGSNAIAEEIQDLMDEGMAKGLVSDEESHMVHGVLELRETQAHSIMVPRTEMSAAPLSATLGEVIHLVRECGHTRIPIYSGTIDKIEGILHAKDLLKLWGEAPETTIPLNLLRVPFFVPETKPLAELLRELKEKQTHMAVVTDEYGGTSGIITIEDILEEIVGEILDEHDKDTPFLTIHDDGTALVDARLEAEKLEEFLNFKLPKGDYESVGGFIIHLLGRIPEAGEKIPFEGINLIIQKSDQRKIDEVLIEPSPGTMFTDHLQTGVN